MQPPPEAPLRFVGLDVHKRYVVVAAVNAQQKIVLPPRRLDLSEFEPWIGKNLKPTEGPPAPPPRPHSTAALGCGRAVCASVLAYPCPAALL